MYRECKREVVGERKDLLSAELQLLMELADYVKNGAWMQPKAMERLNVRTGGYDCTMYGGMCGAGMDNIFYANGKIFICGNCIDLPFSMPYDTPLNEVSFDIIDFDRNCCFKEVFTG